MQAVVDRARAALLDARLTGEAALPSGHQAGASHPAAQGGFYMGEVVLKLLVLSLDTMHCCKCGLSCNLLACTWLPHAAAAIATVSCQDATGNWGHVSYIHLAESAIHLAFDTKEFKNTVGHESS